jgi:hypothetical protein
MKQVHNIIPPFREEVPHNPSGLPVIIVVSELTSVLIVSVLVVCVRHMVTRIVMIVLVQGRDHTPTYVMTFVIRVGTTLLVMAITVPPTSSTDIPQLDLLVLGDELFGSGQ